MTYSRIVILGTSGSGKSTLAKTLSQQLGLRYVELDELHHGPNWKEKPDEEFLRLLADSIKEGKWVVDGNYLKSQHLTWGQADLIIWLDLSFPVVFTSVFKRTMKRWYRKEVLWHGNREHLWTHFFTRDSLLWWVISTFHSRRRKYREISKGEFGPKIVRLPTRKEVAKLVKDLSRLPGAANIA